MLWFISEVSILPDMYGFIPVRSYRATITCFASAFTTKLALFVDIII
jgi:hypothetical protein